MGHLFVPLLIALAALALIALGALGMLAWLRFTLLNGIAVVDVSDVDPALKREIERLELEYAVAEELGYQGDALLGIESQLNRLKLAAAGTANPEATTCFIVSTPFTSGATFTPVATIGDCQFPLPAFVCSLLPDVPYGHGSVITTGWIGAAALSPALLVETR